MQVKNTIDIHLASIRLQSLYCVLFWVAAIDSFCFTVVLLWRI